MDANETIYYEYGCGSADVHGTCLTVEERVYLSIHGLCEEPDENEILKEKTRIAIYCALRRKGLFLRDGTSFGCLFLAYFEHPNFVHSTFLVYLPTEDPLELQRRHRVTSTSLKRMLVVYTTSSLSTVENVKNSEISAKIQNPKIA